MNRSAANLTWSNVLPESTTTLQGRAQPPGAPSGPAEHPVLFCGAMVRAILADRKTQTRRVCRPSAYQRRYTLKKFVSATPAEFNEMAATSASVMLGQKDYSLSPYGKPGDRLWVRETWCNDGEGHICFAADGWIENPSEDDKWHPSIFMPRDVCRITLEITGVRVQRVQDITPEDCRAEGMPAGNTDIGVRYCYGQLWNELNEQRGFGWAKNPWVWVIEFRRLA